MTDFDGMIFDPSGDVILLLKYERADDPDQLSSAGESPEEARLPINFSPEEPPIEDLALEVEDPVPDGPEPRNPLQEAQNQNLEIQSTGSASGPLEHSLLELSIPRCIKSKDETYPLAEDVRCQVSSKHLILASGYFRTMFTRGFSEQLAPRSSERRVIPLHCDDIEAMCLVLKIIHGKLRGVPRELKRSPFLETVALVDKYSLHEITEVFTDIWFEALRAKLPTKSSQKLIPWIYICWVLKKEPELSTLIKIAQYETSAHFEHGSTRVVLPQSLIDQIKSVRLNTIAMCLVYIKGVLDEYWVPGTRCGWSKDCDAMVLGGLLKALQEVELYPIPEASDVDLCCKDFFQKLRSMHLPSLCDTLRIYRARVPTHGGHRCGLATRITDYITVLESEFNGA